MLSEEWELFEKRVSEIRVNQIRVNQGLGVVKLSQPESTQLKVKSSYTNSKPVIRKVSH